MRGAGGGGGGGFFQMILIALIAVAIFALAATCSVDRWLAGGVLVVSGVATLLTPTPEMPKEAEDGDSTSHQIFLLVALEPVHKVKSFQYMATVYPYLAS